jgi:hypothetical protein
MQKTTYGVAVYLQQSFNEKLWLYQFLESSKKAVQFKWLHLVPSLTHGYQLVEFTSFEEASAFVKGLHALYPNTLFASAHVHEV